MQRHVKTLADKQYMVYTFYGKDYYVKRQHRTGTGIQHVSSNSEVERAKDYVNSNVIEDPDCPGLTTLEIKLDDIEEKMKSDPCHHPGRSYTMHFPEGDIQNDGVCRVFSELVLEHMRKNDDNQQEWGFDDVTDLAAGETK